MDDMDGAIGQSPTTSNQSASLQAAKRPRYTAVACDECKRRKIKCDGQIPCHRCAKSPSACVYSQRGNSVASRQETELKRMSEKMSKLQEQIDLLVSSAAVGAPPGQQGQCSSHHPQTPATPVSTSIPTQTQTSMSPNRTYNHNSLRKGRRTRTTKRVQYMGPTSSAYNFGVARTSLHDMGIQIGNNQGDNSMASYSTTPTGSPLQSNEVLFPRDPLLSITPNEAIRLVETYEEESGTVYPFIDIDLVLRTSKQFYSNASGGISVVRRFGDENMLSGGVIDILKLVIAIASVIEGHGPTTLSSRLLEDVESGFEGRSCGPSVDILEIQAWTLMSILQFHCDEEALAWRTIGLAARAAVELGLHHQDTYLFKFSDPQQRLWANKLFWCIYVLDRRWSFGTGLSFALHDDDIDPELSEESDSHSPLLKIMIAYGRLGSKVWKATYNLTAPVNSEKQAFLDFQVRQWQSSIVPDLQLHPDSENMLDNHSRARNRLRVLLYLRTNQMRLLIFRRALLSPKTIRDDNEGAQKAVSMAKDTVRVLNKLNKISDIYVAQQTCFNYFLVSALTAMLLAVCHATTQFNEICREEFYQGLELVRGFSGKSHVARRLWRTVRLLKVAGPKLGVFPPQEQTRERSNGSYGRTAPNQSLTAVSPAPVLGFGSIPDYPTDLSFNAEISPSYNFSIDGNELSKDLTTIFEAIEPSYGQLPMLDPGIADAPGDFDFYSYGTTDGFAKSLFNLA